MGTNSELLAWPQFSKIFDIFGIRSSNAFELGLMHRPGIEMVLGFRRCGIVGFTDAVPIGDGGLRRKTDLLFTTRKADGRIDQIESLRGFAAIYVVLFHALVPLLSKINYVFSAPFRFGVELVMVFFVISGFTVHYSSSRKKVFKLGGYFSSRFMRIYPLFIISMLISYLAYCVSKGEFADPDLRVFFLNLVQLQDANSSVPPYMNNVPLWSLSYEWVYYILYALVAMYLKESLRRYVFIALSIAGCLWCLAGPGHFGRVLMYGAVWWAGVELCQVHLDGNWKRLLYSLATIVAMILALALYMVLYGTIASPSGDGIGGAFPVREIRNLAAGLLTVFGLLFWSRKGWAGFSILKPFAVFAPISYAIYVIHWPIMMTLGLRASGWSPWLWFVVSGAATVLVAIFLERIFQVWLTGLWRRRRSQRSLSGEPEGIAQNPETVVAAGTTE